MLFGCYGVIFVVLVAVSQIECYNNTYGYNNGSSFQPGHNNSYVPPTYMPPSQYPPSHMQPNYIPPTTHRPVHTTKKPRNITSYHWEYEIHHFNKNPKQVKQNLTIQQSYITDCDKRVNNLLCSIRSDPICLADGRIVCATEMLFTTHCLSSLNCIPVESKCAEYRICSNEADKLKDMNYLMPCITHATIVNGTFHKQVCITVYARPHQRKVVKTVH